MHVHRHSPYSHHIHIYNRISIQTQPPQTTTKLLMFKHMHARNKVHTGQHAHLIGCACTDNLSLSAFKHYSDDSSNSTNTHQMAKLSIKYACLLICMHMHRHFHDQALFNRIHTMNKFLHFCDGSLHYQIPCFLHLMQKMPYAQETSQIFSDT